MIVNKNAKTCVVSYGPHCNDIALALRKHPNVDLINAIFITNYHEQNMSQLCRKYNKIIVYERIAGSNGLAQDIMVYCQQNSLNVKVISMCYAGFPAHGTQTQIDEEQQMSMKHLLSHLN
jgi:deoxyxylulose-5-phosphate synthase